MESVLHLENLSRDLEKVGYELAGHLEALSVARLMLMSHETNQIAELLRRRIAREKRG